MPQLINTELDGSISSSTQEGRERERERKKATKYFRINNKRNFHSMINFCACCVCMQFSSLASSSLCGSFLGKNMPFDLIYGFCILSKHPKHPVVLQLVDESRQNCHQKSFFAFDFYVLDQFINPSSLVHDQEISQTTCSD